MRIQPFPVSRAQFVPGISPRILNAIIDALSVYFRDDCFDNRHLGRVNWFREELPSQEKVLNLGCGPGRETFALMWTLKASEAMGIDVDRGKIEYAKCYAKYVEDFSAQIAPIPNGSIKDRDLEKWYRDLPFGMRSGSWPVFCEGDIAAEIPYPKGSFDLVYCRYILDNLVNEDEDWHSAIQNIAESVKPEIGRVVVVGPTTRDSSKLKHSKCFISHDDLVPYFQRAGLDLIKVEEAKDNLGFLEWPETDPKGYVFAKRQ